ncbi:hypothetical protein [Cohnella terricola]|uniref:Uncharacterized protein n=1 Tax=Cohnella terricola TaxID=1289167 RepID=A0A559JWS1_9BACL|nr:hypothetical protein [Cohnella terricola]TVY04277.1 hypothetical protein FPZ45_01395 [Cohnella terricola]
MIDQETTRRVRITATQRHVPPKWAILQRRLFELLDSASQEFIARYVREDGTLIWRRDWPGMDGSDDPYEGFQNLALLYALGGHPSLHAESRRIWDGITWQWTEYGQLHREFDAYYDWMHHGEGSLFTYFLGLAGPATLKDRQRAVRFARMYTGEDEESPNYDPVRKLIRSPLTGSRGPRFEVTAEDWSTHRGILDAYLAPYEDIPGVDFESMKCAWSDDEIYAHVLRLMNERMNKGDVPLNLNATGLVAHAYLHTSDPAFRRWVQDYFEAWEQRAERNGGVVPDNVGLTGEIGEHNEGKWWGGYYGWRWPHGFMTIIEPIVNASMNAALLSGSMKPLRFARQQLDLNWELRQEREGKQLVPYKHFDSGWTDYREAPSQYAVYLWSMSMQDEDLERIERIPQTHDWSDIIVPQTSGKDKRTGRETKHYVGNTLPWFQYVQGKLPDYPERILEANERLIAQQLERMRSPQGDPLNWTESYHENDFSSIHIWQEVCPVYMESLVQLTLGAPMPISHGGLLHGRFRYFDAEHRRPGLPLDVAALVERLDADGANLHLVNTNVSETRIVVVQGGTFGEHRIDSVIEDSDSVREIDVGDRWLEVELPPGTSVRLQVGMSRYAYDPTYETPWSNSSQAADLLRGRSLSE